QPAGGLDPGDEGLVDAGAIQVGAPDRPRAGARVQHVRPVDVRRVDRYPVGLRAALDEVLDRPGAVEVGAPDRPGDAVGPVDLRRAGRRLGGRGGGGGAGRRGGRPGEHQRAERDEAGGGARPAPARAGRGRRVVLARRGRGHPGGGQEPSDVVQGSPPTSQRTLRSGSSELDETLRSVSNPGGYLAEAALRNTTFRTTILT